MKIKWVLMLFAVICALAILVGLLHKQTIHWSGLADVIVTIQVVDKKSGKPLEGVSIELYQPFDPEWPSMKFSTDKNGYVKFKNRFRASGDNKSESISISFLTWKISVKSDGYRIVDDDFSRFIVGKSSKNGLNSVDLHVSILE